MRPMEPGEREPVMERIWTGDLMRATESCVAGFTETGPGAAGAAEGATMAETGPTWGVSTWMSTYSSGGGGSTSSSMS